MGEQWREIEGTEYSVSDAGRVASHKYGKWRVLKKTTFGTGYHRVDFRTNGNRRVIKVHVLVAETFIGAKPTDKHEVNHKNGIKTDNRVENLEWCSHRENMRHYQASRNNSEVMHG